MKPIESDMCICGYMLRTTHGKYTKDQWIMNTAIAAIARCIISGSYEANSNIMHTK